MARVDGVGNQMARDRTDLSSDYAGPSMRMSNELLARGVLAAEECRELAEEERAAIKAELDDALAEYRDGIELDEDV
jgi:exonuclease VII small subunit